MGRKRKSPNDHDDDIKKSKTNFKEEHVLSKFELLPDDILFKICDEISTQDFVCGFFFNLNLSRSQL